MCGVPFGETAIGDVRGSTGWLEALDGGKHPVTDSHRSAAQVLGPVGVRFPNITMLKAALTPRRHSRASPWTSDS